MFIEGPFSDDEAAAAYIEDIADNYSWNYENGSRFTDIYTICGITFILLAATNLVLVAGAWNLYARLTGLCFGCCLGCVNFAALITTAVCRFNTMGKLAALSLKPSKFSDNSEATAGTFVDPEGRVYADDARLILIIWIC